LSCQTQSGDPSGGGYFSPELPAMGCTPFRAASSAAAFEKLHGALVLPGCRARLEGPEIAAPARLRVDLARIKPILAGL
jgi:hypothetical protein